MQGSFSIHNAARRAMRTEGIMGPSEQHPGATILPDGTFFPHIAAAGAQQQQRIPSKRQLDHVGGGETSGVMLGSWLNDFMQLFNVQAEDPATDVVDNYKKIFSLLDTCTKNEYSATPPATTNILKLLNLINTTEVSHVNSYLPLYMFFNSVLLQLFNATVGLRNGMKREDAGTVFASLAQINNTNFSLELVEPEHVDKNVCNNNDCKRRMQNIFNHICKHMQSKHERVVAAAETKHPNHQYMQVYEANLAYDRTNLVSRLIHYMATMLTKSSTIPTDQNAAQDKIYHEWSNDCLRRYPTVAAPETHPLEKPSLDTARRDAHSSGGWWHNGPGFLLVGPYFLSLKVVLYLLRFTQLETMSSSSLGKLVKMVHSNGTVELATWFMVTTCISKNDFWFDSLALLSEWDLERTDIAKRAGLTTLDEDEEDDLTGRMARLVLASVGTQLQDLEMPYSTFKLRNIDDTRLWVSGLWSLVPPIRKGNRLDEVFRVTETERYKMFLTKAPATEEDFTKKVLELLRPGAERLLGYIDECCSNEERVQLEADAMRLDLYYAQMVKGAIANSSVNRGVVWTSSELVDVTDDVSSKLDDILPKVAMQILESIRPKEFYSRDFIDYGSGSGGGNKRMVSGRDVLSVVQRLKDMKVAITDVWAQSRRFRVSDEVHMVELEVLHRLKRDGLVQWFEDPRATQLTHLEICNWFRRNDLTRAKFACVVGRRMLSTRQVTASQGGRGNSGSIMAHQRAVAWAETEYLDFCRFVCEHGDTIERACTRRDFEDARMEPLYYDYAQLATKDLHSEMVRHAKDSVQREFLNPRWSGGAA